MPTNNNVLQASNSRELYSTSPFSETIRPPDSSLLYYMFLHPSVYPLNTVFYNLLQEQIRAGVGCLLQSISSGVMCAQDERELGN